MFDPTEMVTDALHGPRAEVVVALRGPSPTGLARSVAVLAAAPAVEGLILEPDALVDLGSPLWDSAPFTAFLLGRSDIDDVPLTAPLPPVTVLSATPITATEAAWVRLKGADAMREAWQQDGVDVLDQPGRQRDRARFPTRERYCAREIANSSGKRTFGEIRASGCAGRSRYSSVQTTSINTSTAG